MNLNGDEKRIRQLFREMSGDDRARAPEFAAVVAAASSRTARPRTRTAPLKAAAAVAMLCIATLIAIAIVQRSSEPPATTAPGYEAEGPTTPPEERSNVVPLTPAAESPSIATGAVRRRKPARHRRNSTSWAIATNSLFAWQSPTASLMQTPGDELMRSLPRLGESLRTIKSFSSDQFN
jgi:hypothetical protein